MIITEFKLDSRGEPRNGIAPFAEGIKPQTNTSIESRIFPLHDLGVKVYITLSNGRLDAEHDESDYYDKDDTAFTIDIYGKIIKGKARDFKQKGYYGVTVDMLYDNHPQLPSRPDGEEMWANLWLDNTKPIVSSHFDNLNEDADMAYFLDHDRSGLRANSYFMLPNDSAILQAIRINVSIGKMPERTGEVKNNGY